MRYTLALYLFLIGLQGYSQKLSSDKYTFPGIETVREKFFNTYYYKEVPPDFIDFEKRPSGWHISIKSLSGYTHKPQSYHFWSAEKKEYLKLPFAPLRQGQLPVPHRRLYPGQIYNFDKNIFYGYKDWSKDIVSLLQNKQKLSDEHLNSLARAYSNLAGTILTPHYEFQGDIKIPYDEDYNPATISKSKLDSFIYFDKKSIETYLRLIKQNPEYETMVGNIKIKYWNEHLYAYNELMIIQQPELAKGFLKENLYDDFFIAAASNFLNSCKPNSILFTGGDNDTYPLIYVQEKLNIRKDITIINTSLANLGRYIYYLTNVYNGNKINLTLNKNHYKGDINNYCMITKDKPSIDATSFLRKMETGEFIAFSSSTPYTNIPSNKISISTTNYTSEADYPNTSFEQNDTIYFHTDGGMIIKNELMLIDLLATNKWQRPIYMASTVGMSNDIFKNLQKYMVLEGLCYRLTPFANNTENDKVNLEASYDFFLNNYSFKGENNQIQKLSGEDRFASLSIHTFCTLAKTYLSENRKKSIELVNLISEKFLPYNISPDFIELASIYYENGEKEKGYKILAKVYQDYKDNFNPAYSQYSKAKTANDIDAKSMDALRAFSMLYDCCKTYNEGRIIALLEKYTTIEILKDRD